MDRKVAIVDDIRRYMREMQAIGPDAVEAADRMTKSVQDELRRIEAEHMEKLRGELLVCQLDGGLVRFADGTERRVRANPEGLWDAQGACHGVAGGRVIPKKQGGT